MDQCIKCGTRQNLGQRIPKDALWLYSQIAQFLEFASPQLDGFFCQDCANEIQEFYWHIYNGVNGIQVDWFNI